MSGVVARTQSRAEVVEARLKAATSSWVPGKARSAARRIFRGRVREGYNLEQISRVAGCQWFDQDWYLESYPDVKVAAVDPAEHYVRHGWKEGRNPGPEFDTLFYLSNYPRSEEHTSELQSLMRISYDVFCLK